jgi:enediyne biosynthesis protein E3
MGSFRCGWQRRLFGLSLDEVTFSRRGFHEGAAMARHRLEQSGHTFLQGYHAALEKDDLKTLTIRLSSMDLEFRGFAFEGAAMALALLDSLTPWKKNRWQAFVRGPGAAHMYMVHVGVGWAIARLPWLRRQVKRPLAKLDPLLRWLAVDGYGFHEGYFHWPRYVRDQVISDRLTGYARRAFDQGLGRGLWFVEGADVERISVTIATFNSTRHADLWSGVGLACAYAGGVDRAAMETLRSAALPYLPQLAQGAAFAAKARERAGNPAPHTELACQVLCGLPSDAAARLTDEALENLPPDSAEPAYEVWRRRIRTQFGAERAIA